MAKKEIAVKKYVVKLSVEERERLEALIHAGKSSAQMQTRARILLKADVSEAGEGWSDEAYPVDSGVSICSILRRGRRSARPAGFGDDGARADSRGVSKRIP